MLIMRAGMIWPLVKRRSAYLLLRRLAFAGIAVMAVNCLMVGEYFSSSSEVKAGGAVKSLFSYIFTLAVNLVSPGNLYRYLIVLALNAVLIFLYVKYVDNTRKLTFFTVMFAANAFMLAHSVLSHMRDWYFAPTIISLLVLTSSHIHLASDRIKTRIAIGLNGVAIIGVGLLVAYAVTYYPAWQSRKKFYDEACEILDGERVFAYDGSGKLAWTLYSCANSTNGDGLVNSHE